VTRDRDPREFEIEKPNSIAEYWLRRDFRDILLLFNFGVFQQNRPRADIKTAVKNDTRPPTEAALLQFFADRCVESARNKTPGLC